MLQKEFMFRLAVLLVAAGVSLRAEKVQLRIDFEDRDLAGWVLPSAADWTVASEGQNHLLRLVKAGEIGSPRRPIQYAIRKDLCVSDFTFNETGDFDDFRLEGQTSSECR